MRSLLFVPPVVVSLLLGLLTGPLPSPAPELSPAALAGQRIIYSYHGTTPPKSLLSDISAGEVAGVIFFGENITSESQISSVIKTLDVANAKSPVDKPLLLMTDQEGGKVRRLPGAPASSAKQVGQAGNPNGAATAAGTGAGKNLAGVGMNLNLAPIMGVYRHSGDFLDQFGRSFSSDSSTVGSLAGRFITAQQRVGVAATAKHFPGLGAASAKENTDERPVRLGQSLSTLRSVDEAPYRMAIADGVKLVMASWAVYPALDARRPAGLSPTVIGKELRGRLGFHGVTITDALEAGALKSFGSTGQRSVLAAKAGMDLLLCSARDVGQGQAARTALARALSTGSLNRTDFTAAVHRINTLRDNLR